MKQALVAEKRYNASAEQIIEATAKLLGERTSVDVSLSEIAGRSGLNASLIKYYFGNKEGLLLAILKRDAAKAMDALAKLIDMPVSAEQKMKIHISGMINSYYRSPYLNRLIHYMIESVGGDASQDLVKMFIEPMLAAYRSIIDQGVRENTFRAVDPGMLYYSLVGACDHIFHASYSVPTLLGAPDMTDEIKQRYASHVMETFLRGVMREGS